MGKKKNKHKKRKVLVKTKSYNFGPITIERIDRNTIYKSNLSKKEHSELMQKIKENRPKHKKEIDGKINRLIELIETYDPFMLMQKVVSDNQILNLEEYKESEEKRLEVFIEFAQSLIVACKIHGWGQTPDDEQYEEFSKLISEVVFDTVWYFGSEFTEKDSDEPDINAKEEIRFKSIMRFLIQRGDAFESHDEEMINDLFIKHSKFFETHYNLTYQQIINGIYSIKQSIIDNRNLQIQAMIELKKAHEIFCEWAPKQEEIQTLEELKEKFNSLPKVKKIIERAKKLQPKEDYMIINPSEEIPKDLLDLLATELGNNEMFLQFNKCWVINDTIIKEKPLIKHQNKYYCFFYPILGRNIREILETWIKEKDENYFSEYYLKRGRDSYLENKAVEYFQDIFPQATIYQNLKYRINSDEFETDIIVEFDRNLLIIEAKANALKLSSKRGSLVAIQNDTKKILRKSYNQALRTRNYIQSKDVAKFYSKNCNEITISKNNYENIFLINVTLEKLDFLATELDDMKVFGLNKSDDWFWSVYLNDLRIISELVEFPTEFLLYLDRRLQVIEHQFYSSDELDYFMFFLEQGLYFESEDLLGINKFVPYGYTDKLDRYYFFKEGSVSSGEKPTLDISEDYRDLILAIESTGKEYFSIVSTLLLNLSEESRVDILDNLNKINEQLKLDKQSHNFTIPIPGLNIGFTFCIGNSDDYFSNDELEKYCRTKMEQLQVDSWVVIKFIKDINFEELDFDIYFSVDSNKKIVAEDLEKFKMNKIDKYFSKHNKIGRNEPCPCGSGKKYKKCCGKLI